MKNKKQRKKEQILDDQSLVKLIILPNKKKWRENGLCRSRSFGFGFKIEKLNTNDGVHQIFALILKIK